jgi:hypothetical protein
MNPAEHEVNKAQIDGIKRQVCIKFNDPHKAEDIVKQTNETIACGHLKCGTMALGSTQPLTEMSTRNLSWGVKAVGA